MKTYSAKLTDTVRKWHILDASKIPLGRLSTVAASLLLGKGKPGITSHIDMGDFVIIINADSMVATGSKKADKLYYRHSGFPGGLYKRTMGEQTQLNSTRIIEHAVRGMLPDNKLRTGRLARLKIYKTADHSHQGQNPVEYKIVRKGDK